MNNSRELTENKEKNLRWPVVRKQGEKRLVRGQERERERCYQVPPREHPEIDKRKIPELGAKKEEDRPQQHQYKPERCAAPAR